VIIMPTALLLDTIITDGGFTFDLQGDRLVRVGEASGYMIAIPGTETLLGPADMSRDDFVSRFVALARTAPAGVFVGGWLSPERGFMIELSELFHGDRASAVSIGVARRQEAILDLATGEFIPTGGHGDGGSERQAAG
jgi:hypothetical protein